MDNDSSENKNANGSPAQGIFSTPELTVDAEKIAQNVNETNEASRAKIASIFANTETGQQAQRLNDAMTANSQPATEDIVINNGPKKRKKWPIILAVVVLVVAIGGVAGWAVVKNLPKGENVTPATAFANYLEYLEKGPEEYHSDEQGDEWFLFELSDSVLSDTEKSQYVTELKNRYETFARTQTNEDANYRFALDAAIKGQTLAILRENLTEEYTEGGSTRAYAYVNNAAPESASDMISPADNIVFSLREYLLGELSLLEIHDSFGCLVDGEMDYGCSQEKVQSSESYQQATSDVGYTVLAIKEDMPTLESYLKSMNSEIERALNGVSNE